MVACFDVWLHRATIEVNTFLCRDCIRFQWNYYGKLCMKMLKNRVTGILKLPVTK